MWTWRKASPAGVVCRVTVCAWLAASWSENGAAATASRTSDGFIDARPAPERGCRSRCGPVPTAPRAGAPPARARPPPRAAARPRAAHSGCGRRASRRGDCRPASDPCRLRRDLRRSRVLSRASVSAEMPRDELLDIGGDRRQQCSGRDVRRDVGADRDDERSSARSDRVRSTARRRQAGRCSTITS